MKLFRLFLIAIFLTSALSAWSVSRYQIETEHFVFIFEKDNERWAREIASFSEEVYENLAGLLENRPRQIKVVIHSDVNQANGSYYPVPEYLNLYVTSPRDFFLGARTENWLRSLFTHELTHYISMSPESGWLYELSKFFGPILRPAPSVFQPGWVIEGITTYTETRFSKGGRGRNPYFEMIYRAQITENAMPSLKQAAYNPYIQPYGRIYVVGYMMINYLFETYGDDVMARFYRQMEKNPLAPYRAFEIVTGKPTETLYRDMIRFYSERFEPLYDLPLGERFSKGVRIDYGRPVATIQGILSYQNASNENPSRFVFLDPDTGAEQPIAFASLTNANDYDALFDGSRILYSGYEIDYAVEGHPHSVADLFEWCAESGKTRRITKNARLFQPAYIDENTAAAVQTDGPYSRLVSVDLKTGAVQTLFDGGEVNVFHPTVSPDSRLIAFAYNRAGVQSVAVLDRESQTVEFLTAEDGGMLYYPEFDQNGSLFFIGDGSGSLELFERNPQNGGEAVKRLSDRIGVLAGIRYGGRFYYQSYASDGYVIKIAEETAAAPETLALTVTVQPTAVEPTVPDPASLPGVSLTVKRYIDSAQFVGWTPFPINYSPVGGFANPLGFGFLMYAQSVVKNDSVFFMTSFPFEAEGNSVFQPSVFLDAAFEASILKFSYSLLNGGNLFEDETGSEYRQEFSQTLSVSVPLFTRSLANRQWRAEIGGGFTHRWTMTAAEPFHAFGMANAAAGGIESEHFLYSNQNIDFQYSWHSGFRGYPSLAQYVYAGFNSSVLLPIGEIEEPVFLGVFAVMGTIPIVGAHSFFSEICFSASTEVNQTHQLLLRGFEYEDRNTTAALSASFGYQFPIAIVDAPLFATLALHSFSGALFTQIYANFNTIEQTAAFGNYVYLGGELNIQIGFAQAVFPLTVGVSCRIPTSAGVVFDIREDLKPYFSLDIASALSLLRNEELRHPIRSVRM